MNKSKVFTTIDFNFLLKNALELKSKLALILNFSYFYSKTLFHHSLIRNFTVLDRYSKDN